MINFLSTVLAADPVGNNTFSLTPGAAAGGAAGLNNLTIPQIVSFAITAVIVVAGLIFFFMLIIGGLRWVLSGGDKAQTESARSQITAALIGLVIIFSAWAIANLIQVIFNVNILQLQIPNVFGN